MKKHKRITFLIIFVMFFVMIAGICYFNPSISAAGKRKITLDFKSFDYPEIYEELKDEDKEKYYQNIGAIIKGASELYLKGGRTIKPEDGKAYLPTTFSNWGASFEVEVPDEKGNLEIMVYKGTKVDGNEVLIPTDKTKLKDAELLLNPVKIPYDKTGELKETYLVVEGSNGGTYLPMPKDENAEDGSFDIIKVRPDYVNVVMFFLDSSGKYHEDLGVHGWNGLSYEAKGLSKDKTQIFSDNDYVWGSPTKLKKLGNARSVEIMGRRFLYKHGEDASKKIVPTLPGGLVYAGGDPEKFTGDIPERAFLKKAKVEGENSDPKKDYYNHGEVFSVFIHYNGMPYTGNENIFCDYQEEEFLKAALDFKFKPSDYANFQGTYAYTNDDNKTAVQVETSMAYNLLETEKDLTEKDLKERFKGYFSVKEKDKEEKVKINDVLFAMGSEFSKFILMLDEKLDNKKDYILYWDSTSDSDEKRKLEANIVFDLDKEAPNITFVDPAHNLEEKPVVEIKLGSEFLATDIPAFVVDDNRDGKMTDIYVPGEDEGNEKRFVDTSKAGDYEVLFRIVDEWGNVAEKIVIFRVKGE